ncbi:hypothetical protein ABG79_01137 [Caloramator mitchellensis]|uniref:Large ribosomal RNA subunit accumulation protein YceD n=1 Tax=Caloramator mitchellensis TaxID=908809 RepID=A0A0R3JTT0_CALMK|nr:DUF177 domain-containing protein [Caloramator mitchellensis]KRQ86947.1 hypothetical protein ABG79_01137 [Caloramator mitchellensis]
MFLDVSELIRKKTSQKSFDVLFKIDKFQRDDMMVVFRTPIHFKGIAHYDGQIIIVRAKVETMIETICSRCLKPVDYPLEFDFEETFSKQQGEDIYPIIEDRIELDDAIFDNLILSLPLRVLCNENCKGLCPICGQDLNQGQCDCHSDSIDPRLETLKQFFKGD